MKQKYYFPWKVVMGVILFSLVTGLCTVYFEVQKRGQLTWSVIIGFGVAWIGFILFLIIVKYFVDQENRKDNDNNRGQWGC